MSIKAYLYTFDKKPNSTKQPSNGTEYDIELIDDTSIIKPSMLMRGATYDDFLGRFNYCYIPTFNRYYFVTDCTYNAHEGLWHFSMSVDTLASAKSQILATTQMIERSASYNGMLDSMIDNFYPSKAIPIEHRQTVSTVCNATPANGLYIVGINSSKADKCIGPSTDPSDPWSYQPDSPTRFGSVQYWLMSYQEINDLMNYLNGVDEWNNAWTSLTNEMTELLGVISDPLQFIVSCKFLPINGLITKPVAGTSTTDFVFGHIYFGKYQSPIASHRMTSNFINSSILHKTLSIQLSDHPQRITYGVWTNGNKLTQRTLRFEPFGLIPIDCSKLVGYGYLYCDIAIDIIKGLSILTIYASTQSDLVPLDSDAPILACIGSNLLIDIPLSQQRHQGYLQAFVDYIVKPTINSSQGIGSSIVSGVSGGGGLGALISGIQSSGQAMWQQMNSIEDGARHFWGNPTSQGTPDTLLCKTPVELTTCFIELVSPYVGEFGYQVGTHLALANLTGYTKCIGAEFGSTFTATENETIKNHLNNGFYIE